MFALNSDFSIRRSDDGEWRDVLCDESPRVDGAFPSYRDVSKDCGIGVDLRSILDSRMTFLTLDFLSMIGV